MPPAKGVKKIPGKIAGIPTPVLVIGGAAALTYLYLRRSKAGGAGGGGGGMRGPAGRPGRTIRRVITRRRVVLICPPGYRKVNGRCVPRRKRHKR